MQIPQIRIQSQPALIGMRTSEGKQTIEQPRAKQTIHQPKAEMSINSTPAKLTIDQNQAWSDMNLKSVFESSEEYARLGREGLLEGIARRAQQGDQLMRIEDGGDPIVSQAKENSGEGMVEWNIGWIPSYGSVKIDFRPGDLDIQWKVNKPIIEATPQPAHSEYERGNLDIFLRQRNSLSIDFVT